MIFKKRELDCDIIDTEEDLLKYSALSDILTFLGQNLTPIYIEENIAARNKHTIHKILSFIAIISGTIAILAAIILLSDIVGGDRVAWTEFIGAIISLLVVSIGLKIQYHKKWLFHRYKTESLRNLKFQSLIDPLLWCGSKHSLEKKYLSLIDSIKSLDFENSFHTRLESDVNFKLNFIPCNFHRDVEAIKVVVDYYRKKRIKFQMDYFIESARKKERIDKPLQNIPTILFFLGVFMAGADFFLYKSLETSHFSFTSKVMIILAAGFPILGLAIRTFRSSGEFNRSANIFKTKAKKLKEFDDLLDKEFNKSDKIIVKISSLLIQCENLLEEEHYEWLRLMNDSEWFL